MPDSPAITDLRRRVGNLEAEINGVLAQQQIEVSNAYAKFDARLASLRTSAKALQAELNAALAAEAHHPCEGRRVWRIERKRVAHMAYADERLEGIVEVVREVPGALSPLKIGDVIVRHLSRRTGKPVTKWEYLNTQWQLTEEPTP